MKKRIVSFLLALIMALGMLPVTGGVEVAEAAATDNEFKPLWPVNQSKTINVLSHYSGGAPHNGIDIDPSGYVNQTIYAVAKGTVVNTYSSCSCGEPKVGCSCGDTWGNFIVVEHVINGRKYYSRYAHLLYNSLLVKRGDPVNPGDPIAQMGSSGNSTGYHLHLELYSGSNEWDRYTAASPAQRSFDYYIYNPSVIEGVKITTHSASDSNDFYYDWIKNNCTLSEGYYVVNKGHTHSWKVILNNTHHWEECASCGEIRNVVAHSWEMRSNATKHWKYCTVCAATIDNATHSFSAWAVTKEPTYTSTGTDERSCSVCGHKETRTVDRLTLNKPQLSISTKVDGTPKLFWASVEGAKKYEVYRATSSNGTYTKLTSTTSCTYTDSNLTNGTTYFYKVRAVADNNYSQYSTVKSHTYAARYTVVGLVTSFLDDEGAIAVELYTEDSTKAKYSVVVTGNTAEYVFSNVEPGTYTMKVSKKDHATREYRVVVSNSNVTLFAEIFPKGDTDFDGDVNADDLTVLARHVAKIEQLTNAYGSVCADVDGNGSLSADDLTMLARYVAKIIPSLDDSPCIKHKWVASGYDGNTGTVTKYTCSVCKTVGTVTASPFLAPSDAEIEQLGNGTYVFFYSKK